ncbi:MAG: esterase-like activity of phytase family protein [Pseudomonadota bacterium]
MRFSSKRLAGAAVLLLSIGMAGCDGDDGAPGANGASGTDGTDSLIRQTELASGNAHCPGGGVRVDSGPDSDGDGVLDDGEITSTSYVCAQVQARSFRRIATFPVCLQDEAGCNSDTATAAEIAAASEDGLTLIYSDSPGERIGFVDITDPESPQPLGTLAMPGEPTSVAVSGPYALVGVNTSADFINVSGTLVVVDIATQSIVRSIDLGGQPDSVAVSPDRAYAAVVIENERDEDLGDGGPPQLPAGRLVVVTLAGAPAVWTTTPVSLTGIADLYAGDPEPEYVDINDDNLAVVTLQENNHIVLVDLATASVVGDFSGGAVDLSGIDATEEDPAVISQTESLTGLLREPDGVAWLGRALFATANEGDLDGGSRGFSIFNTAGDVVFDSAGSLEQLAARFGQYPDGRSENKGVEPENVEYGVYGSDKFLFVNSERASLIYVYDVADPARPVFKQVLPAALGPEGALAIPARELFVASSEEDSRGDAYRSALNIYRYEPGLPAYPTIQSATRAVPSGPGVSVYIPWGAMSGLAADGADENRLYAIEDSFYGRNRVFRLDVGTIPATLTDEFRIVDSNDVLAAFPAADLADPSVAANDPTRVSVFDEADLDALINDDKTVNVDPEGIAVASDGGFWLVSEGAGTLGEANRPINSLNFLFKLGAPQAPAPGPGTVAIEDVIALPDEINARQSRFGYEGVAESDGKVYVAFQRAWAGDPNPRIGIYDIAADSWSFVFYPLDAVESQNGGWVGLSDLTALGGGQFLVVERDNQGGPDAAIKRLYRFDVTGVAANGVVSKTLVRDLIDDLKAPGGLVPEKIEGLAVSAGGQVYIVNDNDGIDDNSGETQLLRLGAILE